MIRWLLFAYAFSLPFETLWVSLFGLDTIFKPYRLLGLAIAVAWAAKSIINNRPMRFDRYDLLLIGFLVAGLLIAGFWYIAQGTGNLAWAYNDILLTLFPLSAAFVIKNEATGFEDFERLLLALAAGTCASILSALALNVTYLDGRFAAFFDNPNQLGTAAALSIHVVLHRVFFGGGLRWWAYAISLGVVLGLGVALLFSGSRGAILAFAGSIVIQLWLAFRRYRAKRGGLQHMVLVVPFVVMGAIVTVNVMSDYREESYGLQRYDWADAEKGGGRLDIWRSAWEVTADHYYLGVGTQQYRYYHRAYVRNLDNLRTPKIAKADLGTHSQYVEMLASLGIIGFFAYLWLLWHMGSRLWRARMYRLSAAAICLPIFVLVTISQITKWMGSDPVYYLLFATMSWVAAGWSRRTAAVARHRSLG